jgi:tripartite-type tricarboxylate transporter receptor subunit TctC
MKLLKLVSILVGLGLLFSISGVLHAQEKYPSRPIHLIVPMGAGGGTDKVARALAEALKNYLPQPVLIENLAGAGSATGMSKVHSAKPDGYTLGVASGYMITTALGGITKYPANDFTFIARVSQDTFTFSVPVESKHKSLGEIISVSKANPDTITLGNAGTGALTHLASIALNQNTGATFRLIPFQGGAPELTALLGGHIDSGVFSMSEVLSHSQPGGKAKTLAVFSEKRTPKLPMVPSLEELGINGIPEGPWQGICAPKGLPEEIRNVLTEAVRKAANDPSWKDFLGKFGYADLYLQGKDFEEFFKTEMQMLEQLQKSVSPAK